MVGCCVFVLTAEYCFVFKNLRKSRVSSKSNSEGDSISLEQEFFDSHKEERVIFGEESMILSTSKMSYYDIVIWLNQLSL
jgi:hypothetical protein